MRCPIHVREYFGNNVYALRFDLSGISFRPGQYIMAGPAGMGHLREYSLASVPGSGEGRILFRRIPEGLVTPELAELKAGDFLDIRGPFGEFLLPEDCRNRRILFAATGTGIAPFASFAGSSSESGTHINYTLLHGVRHGEEDYLYKDFSPDRLISCVSRRNASSGAFSGRVTGFLRTNPDFIQDFDLIYACGNSDMIYELFSFARTKGFSREQLKAEIYF